MGRCFRYFLVLVCTNQMASGLFRFIAALGRNIIVANTFGSCALVTVFVLGGFIVSRGNTSLDNQIACLLDCKCYSNFKIVYLSSR